jgi:tRNA(fMet)-specific endonuclease VapC
MATGVRYLLDTNICIYITRWQPPEVRQRFEQHGADELAMSVVTYGELHFGAEKSQARDRALAALVALRSIIQVLQLPPDAGEHYGEIRAALQRSGQPIGNNDLWIAAHARALGCRLVTNNEREFVRVPGLTVENWVAPDSGMTP